jgi:hypothetical protein
VRFVGYGAGADKWYWEEDLAETAPKEMEEFNKRSLFSVLEADSPGAGVAMTVTATLPFPVMVGQWPTVVEEMAHKLACDVCNEVLLFCAGPVLQNKVWFEHGIAPPVRWLSQNEASSLENPASVLVCLKCFQKQPSIAAVVTCNVLQIAQGTTRAECLIVWPALLSRYRPLSFLELMQAK